MSLITSTSSFLSIKPRVWMDQNRLCTRTSLVLQTLSLFSYDYRTTVDPDRKEVQIHGRFFWGNREIRRIPFSEIEFIDYDFASLGTSWNRWTLERSDQLESYSIQLVLKDGEKIPLAKFRGEGAASTGMMGVMMGDDIVDWQGNQEDASRSYMETLRRMLKIPLGQPVHPIKDASGNMRCCLSCTRPSPPNKKRCQYCGGEIA